METKNDMGELVGKSKSKKLKPRNNIYTEVVIKYFISIPFTEVGNDIQNVLTNKIKEKIEGKCIKEGYIKENSLRIITYSSGTLNNENVNFTVMLECQVCNPVEDMVIKNCIVKNVSKGGIRAQLNTKKKSPFIIFIHRDHEYENDNFSMVKENDIIKARVIGTRFELNDPFISIIASLEN